MQNGAYWFLAKPLANEKTLGALLERALESSRLRREIEDHRREKLAAADRRKREPEARALDVLRQQIGMSGTATVLIHGETGSGKGLLARSSMRTALARRARSSS